MDCRENVRWPLQLEILVTRASTFFRRRKAATMSPIEVQQVCELLGEFEQNSPRANGSYRFIGGRTIPRRWRP
jgi:hypothetical protein